MKLAMTVSLTSGPELREGEIDRIAETVTRAVQELEPGIDVHVRVAWLIPGPGSVDTRSRGTLS